MHWVMLGLGLSGYIVCALLLWDQGRKHADEMTRQEHAAAAALRLCDLQLHEARARVARLEAERAA